MPGPGQIHVVPATPVVSGVPSSPGVLGSSLPVPGVIGAPNGNLLMSGAPLGSPSPVSPSVHQNGYPQQTPSSPHTQANHQPGYPKQASSSPNTQGYPQHTLSSPNNQATSTAGRLNPLNGNNGPQTPLTMPGSPNQTPLTMPGSPNQVENGLSSSQHQLAVQAMANNQHKMVVMNQQPMNGQQMLINGLQPQGRKDQYPASVTPPDPQYHHHHHQPVDQVNTHDSNSSTHNCPPTSSQYQSTQPGMPGTPAQHCPPTSSHYQSTQPGVPGIPAQHCPPTSSHYQSTQPGVPGTPAQHCPPTSSHYQSVQQPSYRRQNLQQPVNNNNNHMVNNNNIKPSANKQKPAPPAWRNSAQQNLAPNPTPHQFQNGQFIPGQTHVVNGQPMPHVNGHYAINGQLMNGFNGHMQQVNGLSGQPVNMPQVSLAQQNCMQGPQAGYGATLHMGGGQFAATGSPAMRIPVTNLAGGCPIHQPNMPQGGPHIMHWDANHLSGHPVPLRQPNPPVYYNVPAPSTTQGVNNQQNQSQVQDSGSGSQSPSSDMSAQTGSGGSDASSEESAAQDLSRQQSVQYVQGGYGNGYPVQCVVHYGSPAIHSKEVYDIHGRKIHNFEQHFSPRNMQVH
jgi:hypothetical protein